MDFYNFLTSKEEIDFDSKEFEEKFSSFAKQFCDFLHEVDDYYKNPETPKVGGINNPRNYNLERLLLKGNYLLTDIYHNGKDIEKLKENSIDKLKKDLAKYAKKTVEKEEEPVSVENKVEEKPSVQVDPLSGLNPEIRKRVEAMMRGAQKQEVAENAVDQESPEQEAARFAKLAKALEKAKTITNSQEYKDIIAMCKSLGDKDALAQMGDDGRKAMLAATGKKINDYLFHKAKDGVKPNVFKKFAAVEALSSYLDTKLEPYSDETISIGKGQNVVVSDLKLSFGKNKAPLSRDVTEPVDEVALGTCLNEIYGIGDPALKGNMTLATQFLRKVGYERLSNNHNGEVNDIYECGKKFSNEKFVKSELSGQQKELEDTGLHM